MNITHLFKKDTDTPISIPINSEPNGPTTPVLRMVVPEKRLLNDGFKYVNAANTDIRKTFKKVQK